MQNPSLAGNSVGAVFTPLRWAKWLVNELDFVAKWVAGATVCDPTAGKGVFIHAMLDVATAQDIEVNQEMLSRLFAIEQDRDFLTDFLSSFRMKYGRDFPSPNALHADLVLDNPRLEFDILVGNPPWINFCDLPVPYRETLKRSFIEYGLVEDRQKLLLGSARVDFAALILSAAFNHNLAKNGEAAFFLPLSLFLNDGAHGGFRRFALKDSTFQVVAVWDFCETRVFPEIATRFGVGHFRKDAKTVFPIPYHVEEDGKWVARFAAPIGGTTAPFSIVESAHDFEELSESARIKVREDQKPRQGVNTCGANDVFIFTKALDDLPPEFVFPLVTKECFPAEDAVPRRYVLLPYDSRTGRPLSDAHLKARPALWHHFQLHKVALQSRKGTMLNAWIQHGRWWACLGVGKYSFAPFKIIWEAYGKDKFNPKIFAPYAGQPWQANQAMHAFIPCSTRDEAERLLQQLTHSNVAMYLKSLNMKGTCNWAQPGRIKRFLKFVKKGAVESPELQLL